MRPQPLSGEYPTGGLARTTPPECKRCVPVWRSKSCLEGRLRVGATGVGLASWGELGRGRVLWDRAERALGMWTVAVGRGSGGLWRL